MKNGILKEIEWSHFSTTCAAIDENRKLHIFKSNGNDQPHSIENQGKITSISWSYHSDLLAIGSSSNVLTLFSNKTKQTKSIQLNTIIKRPFQLSTIFWNFFLEQVCLISSDNQLLVLNITEKQEPSFLFCVKLDFSIENATFLSDSKIILTNKEGELYLITNSTQKYLTTILTPVHSIYCSKSDTHQIISISSDNIFTAFILNDQNTLKKLDQRKLNDGHFTHIEEVGNERIAFSINDTVYIEKSGENSIELIIQKNDKITDFHYYNYSNSLVAVSEKGNGCIWSFDGEIQLIQKFELKNENTKIFISTFSRAICSINENEKSFSILKLPKIRYLNSGYSELMQTDSNTLISNSMNRIQKVENSIEKVRQTKNHFLIVSDSKCKVFNFNFECINEFKIQSNLIEISGSRIFTINGQIIESRNIIDNSILNSFQIESNGSIIKTALNGLFLAVLTTSNEVLIFDISKFSIRQKFKLNASHLIESYSVTSLGISNGGFCVSINCRTSKSRSKSILLSSKSEIHSNFVFLNDCMQLKWDTETPNLFCTRTYENSLVTHLIDDELKIVQLKSLSFNSNLSFLKVSVPRFFCSNMNTLFFSVTSNFLPSFASLDEAPIHVKQNVVQLMFHVQCKNFEYALKLIEKIDDKNLLNQFFNENDSIEFFSNLIDSESEANSEVPFSDVMHRSLNNGNLSLLVKPNLSIQNCEAKNWYGRFSEFRGDTKTALSIYSKCQNEIDQVRLLCIEQKFFEAKKIVDNTSNKSVICYFARMLIKLRSKLNSENQNKDRNESQKQNESNNLCNEKQNQRKSDENNKNENLNEKQNQNENNENESKSNKNENLNGKLNQIKTDENNENEIFNENQMQKFGDDDDLFMNSEKVGHLIVDLFCRSERYGAALEFSSQEGFFEYIEKLSPLSPKSLVYKVAKSLENRHINDLSIHLYFQGGFISDAVRTSLSTLNFECLTFYEDKITQLNDTQLFLSCAEHFEKVGNYEEAVNFYAYSKCIEKVEELCVKEKVKMSENLIEFLSSIQNESVARLLDEQGQFLKASQIYFNLNQYSKALNSLIKLNDIEKVINFTEKVKSPICYSISADFIVDSFNPRKSSPLFQKVIEFYRKSGDFEKIAKFYETRAKIEIDNGQNYEKALDLLKESQLSIAMTDSRENFGWVDDILNKIRWIEMYIEAASTKSPEAMEAVCNALLNTENALSIVRYEDIVFLQIQNFLRNENFVDAQKLIDKLREKGVDIEKFIESDSIKRIYRAATHNDSFDLSDEMPDDDNFIIEHFSDS